MKKLKNHIKQYIRKNSTFYNLYSLLLPMIDFFRFRPASFLAKYYWFFKQLKIYRKLNTNTNFRVFNFYPCLFDNIGYTPTEPIYTLQDLWFARHIFSLKPKIHYDIGSSIKTISIIAQFTKVVFVDIRPPSIVIPNLELVKSDIRNLPFLDNSIYSISSLCVIEHIGLGRYGDEIDPFGSEKAINELKRVCAPGGIIYISVPVDAENKIYFNANRAFSREYIMQLFEDFEVLDEKYIYGDIIYDNYDKSKGFGTGLYMFRKKTNNFY